MLRKPILLFVCLTLALGAAGLTADTASAQEICFPGQPGVTECLAEPFAAYWQANGGLPVFGYPITSARPEAGADGRERLTQWTERNRLESHPDNPAPYRILLGRMGAERLAQLGRDPAAEGRESGPRAGCLWFAETGHNVCNQATGQGFRAYWEANGLSVPGLSRFNRSLMLFGLPLTAATMERNANGEMILTQWFERARFEWHPDNPARYRVLLGLLGNEMRASAPPAAAGPSVFGVEIGRGIVPLVANRLGEARINWVRYNGIVWSEVEPTQGNRDWSRIAGVEAEIRAIAEQGAAPVVIIRGAPAWAQKVPGSECGPIKPEALDAFADFMRSAVARYSAPPYNVKYWEMGNEPDVDPSLIPAGMPFGCWGDANDEFYGGGYYAEMLKRVYPAIKSVDPDAQVVVGGLLLGCDPTNPPPNTECRDGRFLEGILRNGGGAAFDIMAYHSYMYWGEPAGDWDLRHPFWSHRGGIFLGKLDFVRETMRRYGVDKPIMMNEGGLLCFRSDPRCSVPAFYADQANYAVRLYARTWANGLLSSFWYTLNGPGWQEGGLLDANQAPRPAFQTLRFMATLLEGATFSEKLGGGALEGYAFRKGATTYQIYWTNDRSTVELPLPAGVRTVYDVAGQALQTSGSTLTVGFRPVIVEIAR